MIGFIWRMPARIYKAATWERSPLGFAVNFAINFFPVYFWLMAFKHADIIPLSWRPAIHNQAAFIFDLFLFGDAWLELTKQYGKSGSDSEAYTWISSILFAVLFCILIPLALWYYIYYVRRLRYNILEPYQREFHDQRSSREPFSPKRLRVLGPFLIPIATYVALNTMHAFAQQDPSNFTKTKDIVAWVWYVLLHLIVPIITGVYLYLFHPPGTLKCFSYALGIQNITGLLTHLLIPMAPPWFIHMYGIADTEHVNYDQKGYAAGLTRVDSHMGTHANSKGFHKSPIVFGAVPSLHSAIAVQCFLFIVSRSTCLKGSLHGTHDINVDDSSSSSSDGSASVELLAINDLSRESLDLQESSPEHSTAAPKSTPVHFSGFVLRAISTLCWLLNTGLIPKVCASVFLIVQWWATMYLDHHFRFDLFVGMLYAVASFAIVNIYILHPRILSKWLAVRVSSPAIVPKGTTMGMRVFEGTRLMYFFDPLA